MQISQLTSWAPDKSIKILRFTMYLFQFFLVINVVLQENSIVMSVKFFHASISWAYKIYYHHFWWLLLHLNCQIYKAKEMIFYNLAVGNYCDLWLANYPSVAYNWKIAHCNLPFNWCMEKESVSPFCSLQLQLDLRHQFFKQCTELKICVHY